MEGTVEIVGEERKGGNLKELFCRSSFYILDINFLAGTWFENIIPIP